MYKSDKYMAQVVKTPSFAIKLLSALFMDSSVFIFPTLLADFKVLIQNYPSPNKMDGIDTKK